MQLSLCKARSFLDVAFANFRSLAASSTFFTGLLPKNGAMHVATSSFYLFYLHRNTTLSGPAFLSLSRYDTSAGEGKRTTQASVYVVAGANLLCRTATTWQMLR